MFHLLRDSKQVKGEAILDIFEAFKSVKNVNVEWFYDDPKDIDPLEEDFLVSAAQHGVRHMAFKLDGEGDTPASTAGALSFGLAEPAAGGGRSLLGVACEIGPNFLAQIKQVRL